MSSHSEFREEDNPYYAEMERKKLPQPSDWPFDFPLTFKKRRDLHLEEGMSNINNSKEAKPKDRFRKFSLPENPACKVHSDCCSGAMALTDLCLWHYYLQGSVWFYTCGCGVKHPVASGFSYPKWMVMKYFGGDQWAAQDGAGYVYCCGDASGFCPGDIGYQCGEMHVCWRCREKHPHASAKKSKVEDSEESDEDWDVTLSPGGVPRSRGSDLSDNKRELYKDALTKRMGNGEFWMYCSWNDDNTPAFSLPTSTSGTLKIRSAKDALRAGSFDMEHYAWWVWVAGWYDDCPQGVTKH
jgi:hypothetical protein